MKLNKPFVTSSFLRWVVSCVLTLSSGIVSSAEDKLITSQPAEDEFGRLFTSQYERSAIDRARLNGGFIPAKVTGIDENPKPIDNPQPTQPIKVLGVLLRADGKNKVWLSGGTEAPHNILNGRSIIGNINQSANVKVGVNNGAILKPGQVWSPLTGQQESYQIPVPKPVVDTTATVEEKQKPPAVSVQTSSAANSSEAQSSVSSSAK